MYHIPAVQPKSSATREMLTAGYTTGFYLQARPFFVFFYITNVLHCRNQTTRSVWEEKTPGVPPYGKNIPHAAHSLNAAPRAATSDLQHNYSKFKARSG